MPDVPEIVDDVEAIASTAGDDHQVELLLAGFRACAKEAIRFLLEEEGLAPDHDLPMGLQEHLDRQQSHLAGMLQNDSGLGSSRMDDSFCYDESFLGSETSDPDCSDKSPSKVDTVPSSNASTDPTSSEDTDLHVSEPLLENSSP